MKAGKQTDTGPMSMVFGWRLTGGQRIRDCLIGFCGSTRTLPVLSQFSNFRS